MRKLIMSCLLIVFALNVIGQNVIVNPDGTHSIVHGNVIVNSDGSHSIISGNVIVNPDGTHTVVQGNIMNELNRNHFVVVDDDIENTKEVSEKNDNFLRDINSIVEELKFMYDLDQTLREYTLFKTFDKCITDSIESLSQEEVREYIVANKFESNTLSRRIYEKYISPIDELNTKRLIELIDKYGFPSLSRIKKHYEYQLDKEFNPYILIVHAPRKYWDELKQIIKREREIGNLNKCEYGHILWHLNGRKNMQDMLDNGFTLVRDENGLETLKAIDCD